MKKLIVWLPLALIISYSKAQSISASLVQVYSHTNAVVPVVNGGDNFENTSRTFALSYEHFFRNSKYSIFSSYSKYDGCTFIYFEPGGWIAGGGEALATGSCQGVKLHRFDLGVSYLLTKKNKKFYFKPFVGAGLQVSRKTEWEFGLPGLPINGPHYFELEPMEAIPMNTSQIVPSLGFRTGFVFWKRLELGLGVHGVYAFRPYQKMYLKYQYKGTVQPMAEYESTGTGLFVTLGVGYRFAKLIK
ncbi:MAG: hypothetical protein J0L99_07615 [Chitinophagales bacterium]|nr:hypothetical protein [Chitinophagales bacterium]